MQRIGITGGIGSGKSIVCTILEKMGYSIFYADKVAKELVNTDGHLRKQIISLLGKIAFTESGNYNRSYVAQLVFEKPELLAQLNAIIHPAVGKAWEKWCAQRDKEILVFKEAALLSGKNQVDFWIYVDAPVAIRMDRVLNRDIQRSKEDVKNIMENQPLDNEYKKITDFTILNTGSLPAVIPQVLEILSKLRNV